VQAAGLIDEAPLRTTPVLNSWCVDVLTPHQTLIEKLNAEAIDCRRWIVRAGYDPGTQVAGSLSAIDILVALYLNFLRVDPRNPGWEDRDRFILSKGHDAYALYIVLAKRGFISFEDLKQYERLGSYLSTHPSRKLKGVDFSTGSLGHGLSAGVGMAIVSKREDRKFKVYVMIGDGEMQEGSIWEAAMSASKYELDNLVAIVDRNMLGGGDDYTEKVMPVEPLEDKWKSFGWATIVIDGHNMNEIVGALEKIPLQSKRPTAIIAKTVKGKGVSFIENQPSLAGLLHFTAEERDRALRELGDVQ